MAQGNRPGERRGTRARRAPAASRRGVASVVAMMFLMLFGSLAAAMAIASKGNIRTAATHLHVSRALSAAETGLAIATRRLEVSTQRFVVSQSNINPTFGQAIWSGSGVPGQVVVQPPPHSPPENPAPTGIVRALANLHAADLNLVPGVSVSVPTIGNRMAGVDPAVYASGNWLYTPAVAVEAPTVGATVPPPCFSITYAPLANGTDVRVIVTGLDFNYQRSGQPVTRTIMQDFRLAKSARHAILSSNRIMIGKNVTVWGDLGARYQDVGRTNGDPIVTRSDFLGLDGVLDQKLNLLYGAVRASDVDGDNRLRVNHPTEGAAIPSQQFAPTWGGPPGAAFFDVTGDGYVDDFDIFIIHYDRNGDARLTLSAGLTAGTPAAGLTPEFTADDQLALLIDGGAPDRNRNGVWGWSDDNLNGRWDPNEAMLDRDPVRGVNRDQILGWRDGSIDKRDQYGKVHGGLRFSVQKSAWESAQGPVPDRVRGPIRPGGIAAQTYGVSDTGLPAVTPASVSASNTALRNAADGASFQNQVQSQTGRPGVVIQPLAGDVAPVDGLPDNWQTAYFEKVPFNSPSHSDYYYRPVYQGLVFKDVVIPPGTNALFRGCTFVGVTYIQSQSGNTHLLWNEYGKMQMDALTGKPMPTVRRNVYGGTAYPTMLPPSALPPNQPLLIATDAMQSQDKADVPSNSGVNVSALPEPLVVNGKRYTDTRLLSNNIRFHDCLFVGSVVSDTPQGYTQVRNKLQFTGATRFVTTHPEHPDDPDYNPEPQDLGEIAKSSLMVPNYSVDIGHFNSPDTQNVKLNGAIVAGVLDVRGNTDINGALMLTFSPVYGEGPLRDARGNPVGNPAEFNTTLGYFGPTEGDSESLNPNDLPLVMVAGEPKRLVGYDTNGDGLADLPHSVSPVPGGAVPVYFHGYGRINVRFDPSMVLPDGIMLPMGINPLNSTYREGKP